MHKLLAKRHILTLLAILALPILAIKAQSPYDETGWLPDKGNHLVYDFCNILSDSHKKALEERLQAFSDSTSNQIAVLLTPAFGGDDISSFAFRTGDKWGIGQKGLNNGVLIVVKPKTNTDGQVEIATGTGLEGALPDIFCKRIIEDRMIPRFREDDYYGGINDALDVILPVCAGEYSFSQYKDDNDDNIGLGALIFGVIIIAIVLWAICKIDKSGGISGPGGTFVGGNTRMGPWVGGGFGGFGGSSPGGGFGGFGGGGFSGGGASSRW